MKKLILSLVLVAPVSIPCPEPPPEVLQGKYRICWGGQKYVMDLEDNGNYTCYFQEHPQWYGTWKYDRANRSLFIKETSDGNWYVKLGRTLNGEGGYVDGIFTHDIGLTRVKR